MRLAAAVSLTILLASCGQAPVQTKQQPGNAAEPAAKVKLEFYAENRKVAKGLKANLCYSVENAARVQLDPPVEEVWPSLTRCFEVAPVKNTTYTLTAFGADGASVKKTADVSITAPPPRLYDLWVNSLDVKQGEEVRVCFKVENTQRVKTSAGKLDPAKNCISDIPAKTTTYKITAMGGDNEIDSGTVTVRVH